RRGLLSYQLPDLLDDLALRARAEHESGERHHDDEPGGEREDRVVGESGPYALGAIFVPVAHRSAQQWPHGLPRAPPGKRATTTAAAQAPDDTRVAGDRKSVV